MSKRLPGTKVKEKYLAEFRRQLALERFQEERPQLWLQSQRVGKLVEIQEQVDGELFPEGSCFLHANLVGSQSFCVKRITGIDLDTCQVTLEIYNDEDTDGGIVVLPLETIEWFAFPAKAVSMGVHFQGFTGTLSDPRGATASKLRQATDKAADQAAENTDDDSGS
jgi:hypothetical protein